MRNEAGKRRVDESTNLHDPATHEHWKKITDNRPHVRGRDVEYRTEPPHEPKHGRKLNHKLQRAANNRSPGCDHSQVRLKLPKLALIQLAGVPTKENHRGDDCEIPNDRRCI